MTRSAITRMPPGVRRLDQLVHVVDVPVVGVDRGEVGDVVAAVPQGRSVERQQPDAVDAQPLEVVELLGQPAEVARAVAVGVEEAADVDLVEHRALEPQRLGLEPLPGLRLRCRRVLRLALGPPRSASRRAIRWVRVGGPTLIGVRPRGRARLDLDAHDVRLSDAGLEPDEVGTDAPLIALVGEQVVGGEARWKTEVGGHDRESLLGLVRVDADDGDDRVPGRVLGVGDQRVVGGVEEGYVGQVVERGVLTPDGVQALDVGQQRAVERALLDLVFLRVQVLLGAELDRDVLEVLVAGVDAIARAERGGEDQPGLERRRGRRAGGTRAGCPACWRRSSAGSTRSPRCGPARRRTRSARSASSSR